MFLFDKYLKLSNLEWCTASENIKHVHLNGLSKSKKGQDVYNSVLRNKDVLMIKIYLKLNVKNNVIAKQFGVSNSTICDIKKERTWKHIEIETLTPDELNQMLERWTP